MRARGRIHTPYAATLPEGVQPSEAQLREALARHGKPVWNEEDFQQLLRTLGWAGYGWLREDGVRRKLEQMADQWQGPLSLDGR